MGAFTIDPDEVREETKTSRDGREYVVYYIKARPAYSGSDKAFEVRTFKRECDSLRVLQYQCTKEQAIKASVKPRASPDAFDEYVFSIVQSK
jgi:hypothetical protein